MSRKTVLGVNQYFLLHTRIKIPPLLCGENARVNQEIITAVKHFGVTNLASIFDSLSNYLYLLPIFLYVNGPFPLEMLVFVIIGEERLDSVGSTPQSS